MQKLYQELKLDFNFQRPETAASNYTSVGQVYKKVPHNRLHTGWGDGLLYASANTYHKMFQEQLRYRQLLYKGSSVCGDYYYHVGGGPGMDTFFCYLAEMDVEITLFSNYTTNQLLSDSLIACIEGKSSLKQQVI